METERLYIINSYDLECDAAVISCSAVQDGFDVILDRTVLFPTGGGQPHDTGTLGGVCVTDVREEGDTVIHRINQPVAAGDAVHVAVDWERRFDHMQQHTGEHMLSFAAHEMFGAVNVGFHMAEGYSTIDLDQQLTQEQGEELERLTNTLLQKDLPVELTYVTAEELEGMCLRKKAAGLTGKIRIVSMPGGDSCTCCATHVAHTGEVGQCKITSLEHYKGGSRITFACGGRALKHAQAMQCIVERLAKGCSCKPEAVPEAIERLRQDNNDMHRENKLLQTKLNGYLAQELLSAAEAVRGIRVIVCCLNDCSATQMKALAQTLCKEQGVLTLLAVTAKESIQYMLNCSENVKLDMGELCQAVNAATGGKGGGRGTQARGSAPASSWQKDAFAQLEAYLKQRIAKG